MTLIYLIIHIAIFLIAKKSLKDDIRLIINLLTSICTTIAIIFSRNIFDFKLEILNSNYWDLVGISILLITPAIYHLVLIVLNKKEDINIDNNFLVLILLLALNNSELRSLLAIVYCLYNVKITTNLVVLKSKLLPLIILLVSMAVSFTITTSGFNFLLVWLFVWSILEINTGPESQLLLFTTMTLLSLQLASPELIFPMIIFYIVMCLKHQIINPNLQIINKFIESNSVLDKVKTKHIVKSNRKIILKLNHDQGEITSKKKPFERITREINFEEDLTLKLSILFIIIIFGVSNLWLN